MGLAANVSQSVHDELAAEAKKHPGFQTFLNDMQKLAENVWHKVRVQASDDAKEAVTEAEGDAVAAVTPEAQTVSTSETPGA
jgi:hypothetical protein